MFLTAPVIVEEKTVYEFEMGTDEGYTFDVVHMSKHYDNICTP